MEELDSSFFSSFFKALGVFFLIVILGYGLTFALSAIFDNKNIALVGFVIMPCIAFPLGHFIGKFFANRERKNGRY
ncbi:MAG: hypothetical protein AB1465_01135 [Patescibacteria group bacterium]